MSTAVLRGDARHLPLPDACVDLIVTSPPYYGLRSYTDGGEHYAGQIGSEPTPAEYVAALVACTAEWVRVLKPSGSLFVNLGDKYAAGHGGSSTEGSGVTIRKRSSFAPNPRERPDLPDPPASWSTRDMTGRTIVPGFAPKSLMGLPWRYALAATDQLGLILRAEIIWAKPNGLPESVTDRVRRAHEQVFHFTRQPRYYTAVDEIREQYDAPKATRTNGRSLNAISGPNVTADMWRNAADTMNPLGKLPGSVWTIPSQPLTVPPDLGVDHFAAYPMELVRRIILGWSPPGICQACGEGRRPVSDQNRRVLSGNFGQYAAAHGPDGRTGARKAIVSTVTGYACACPAPTAAARPAVVLDPFAGTGTTLLVAAAYGRIGIGTDMSHDYCRLARWRTTDPGELARALEVDKPPVQVDGQDTLFEVTA